MFEKNGYVNHIEVFLAAKRPGNYAKSVKKPRISSKKIVLIYSIFVLALSISFSVYTSPLFFVLFLFLVIFFSKYFQGGSFIN